MAMNMKTGIPRETEKEILKFCLDFLQLHKVFAFRNNSGFIFSESKGKTRMIKVGLVGSPDIIGMTNAGKFFGIEVKRKGKTQSEFQKEFEKKCLERNGFYFLVDDPLQMQEVVKTIKGGCS